MDNFSLYLADSNSPAMNEPLKAPTESESLNDQSDVTQPEIDMTTLSVKERIALMNKMKLNSLIGQSTSDDSNGESQPVEPALPAPPTPLAPPAPMAPPALLTPTTVVPSKIPTPITSRVGAMTYGELMILTIFYFEEFQFKYDVVHIINLGTFSAYS